MQVCEFKDPLQPQPGTVCMSNKFEKACFSHIYKKIPDT